MNRTSLLVMTGFMMLGLNACGNFPFRTVTAREYQVTSSSSHIILDIDMILRESMLNIEEPLAKKRSHVRVELVGDGIAESGGWIRYVYPGDIKTNYVYGNTGYALLSPERNEVRLRLYWRSKDRTIDSEVNGDYRLEGHEDMPPGLIIFDPEHMFWSRGAPCDEKTVTIRIGSSSDVKIASIYPVDSHFSVRIESAANKKIWRVILRPIDTAQKTHEVFQVEALVEGKIRRLNVTGSVL